MRMPYRTPRWSLRSSIWTRSRIFGARFKMLDDSLAFVATFTQVVYFTRDINPEFRNRRLCAMRQRGLVLGRTRAASMSSPSAYLT